MNDNVYRSCLFFAAVIILSVSVGIFLSLTAGSLPVFREFGLFDFITSGEWNYTAGREHYGAMPFIVGTLATSFPALLLCMPFTLAVALFTGEYFRGKKFATCLDVACSLLAGIPSIVYGLWGFYALTPLFARCGVGSGGFGILSASIILAIMIIPYAANLTKEFIVMVPNELKEAAYSLGATHFEVIMKVVLPKCLPGIFSAFILALGRALGETMAVTMLIGNTNLIPHSLTDTGNTMASIIANQFGEADGVKLSALIGIALLLFAITFVINLCGKLVVHKLKV